MMSALQILEIMMTPNFIESCLLVFGGHSTEIVYSIGCNVHAQSQSKCGHNCDLDLATLTFALACQFGYIFSQVYSL